jgi:hypothetical protein
MSRMWKHSAQFTIVASAMLVIMLFFQNCGQVGSISVQNPEGYDYDDNGIFVPKQQAEKALTSSDAPPLKLVFIMDNSNSMTLNNLNLQQSISSMFDNQANNLSQFNAEMYFLTTAQLPSLSGSFAGKLRSPSSVVGSSAQIENSYRNPFTGLISGDLLGFDIQKTETPNIILKEYKAQPVVKFQDTAQGTVAMPSIKYAKGSSVDALKAEVVARLSVLSSSKASQITDTAVFPALDTESGLCALGRILRFPDNFIRPGDVTSFIIVSDENEADVAGTKCLGSEKREFLYKIACVQRIPATVKKETQINFQSLAGVGSKRTVFTITPPNVVNNKVITTLSLNRSARNAACTGAQEREFTVNYQVLNKSFVIRYSKKPKIGEREGGVPIYGVEQLNLVTANQVGTVPADCAINLPRLKTILNDSTSTLTIISCAQNPDVNVNQPAVNLTYASHPAISFGGAATLTCPAQILSVVNPSGNLVVNACTMSRKSENISASTLASKGFTASSSQADCETAVAKVCSDSANTLRSCTYGSFSAAIAVNSRGPVSATQNSALNCNSTCATFPGLCTIDNMQTVNAFAAANNYVCAAGTARSTETFITSQLPRDVAVAGTFSCDNTCAQVPGACLGMTSASPISQYNLSCMSKVEDVLGSAPQNKVLAKILDADVKITCDTLCSESSGACMGALTIGQHITNNLSGQNCSVQRLSTNIAEVVNRKDILKIKEADLLTKTCDAGFGKEGNPVLTSDYEDSLINISGDQTLPNYIINRMNSIIGVQAATLSAFITPAAGVVSGSSTSYGVAYEQLVSSWGKGSVHDIRNPSYAPALTQLSQVLRGQLLRSVKFPEVKSTQRIRSVWKKANNASSWGVALAKADWSATGGTVTLAANVELDVGDLIKIEFY